MKRRDKRKLEEKTTIILEYKWDLEEDTIGSTTVISLVSKKRGKSQNMKIEEANGNSSMITRRSLAVLSASIISTDCVLSTPLQVGAKLLLSRAAQLLPGGPEVWRKPLMGVDNEFV